MKNAYLLLTDLHYAESKANRVNYLGEVLDIVQSVLQIADECKEKGYNTKLILLGDVVDRSMSSSEDALSCQDVLRFFFSQFSEVYCVVGNHEETFITDNPFWYFVSEIGDETLAKLPRGIQPKSVIPCITVPSTVTDGEVTFYFNHYGIPPKVPDKVGKTIGLFHQNVGSNDICKMWGTFDDVEEAAYIQGYNYCFLGHMHLAYGKYYLNEQHTCLCEWLGSAVRANVLEVENAPLEVNVPAVLVVDGRLEGIEDHLIARKPASECIVYDKVNLMRENTSKIQQMRDSVPKGLTSSTLLESIRDSARLVQLEPIIDMLLGSMDTLRMQYKDGLRQASAVDISVLETDDGGKANAE